MRVKIEAEERNNKFFSTDFIALARNSIQKTCKRLYSLTVNSSKGGAVKAMRFFWLK